ncbi:hypothetical protein [Amorphus orientalis]|uniref:Uncharacterized protein n=1 Tax=Amorphus orientalis TaxID=649198 RepID=A0AAE4AW28_9HYPH|nr:hypothetical protein [Amorphus orientalis]MDQ0317324.1 hypothetical protein [Amorphus orientalis]
MRTILILFVAIAALLGIVMLTLAVRDGGFEQAGRIVDQEVGEAGEDAQRMMERAGDSIEQATDEAAGETAPAN